MRANRDSLVILVFVLLIPQLLAQVDRPALEGTVTDPTGAALGWSERENPRGSDCEYPGTANQFERLLPPSWFAGRTITV
jgi:hypothetical protein